MIRALLATLPFLVATMPSAANTETGTTTENTVGTTPASTPPRIAWFTSWEQAKAEARRTGRPIFLQSAAPRCQGVPGMW